MKLRKFLQERFERRQLQCWLAEVHDGQQWVSARKLLGMNSGDDSVLLDLGRLHRLDHDRVTDDRTR